MQKAGPNPVKPIYNMHYTVHISTDPHKDMFVSDHTVQCISVFRIHKKSTVDVLKKNKCHWKLVDIL